MELKREIGVLDVAFNAVNNTIGGGIFLLPAIVAGVLGSVSILAYVICAIMVSMVMLCFAELGSKITKTGGSYAYVEANFGSFAGFIIGSFSWFGAGVIADAAIANGLADLISNIFPIFSDWTVRLIFFFFLFGGYSLINIMGVKSGMNIVRINTLLKIIPLLIFVIWGLVNIESKNLYWDFKPTWDQLGSASLILFFAFQGAESALNIGGEMKNPKRTAPMGILLGIGLVVIFYILIHTVAQGILGTELEFHKAGPLAEVAKRFMGPIGGILLLYGAIWSIFSNLGSSPLLFPRILYAASKDELLPAFLGKIHPKYSTPYWSILTYSALTFILAISGGFRELAIISSASILIIYFAVVVSLLKMKWKNNSNQKGEFNMLGGILIPMLSLIFILWFLIHLSVKDVTGIALFVIVLTLFYYFHARNYSK